MARSVTPDEVNRLARLGAAVRLQQLEEEAAAIRRMFPGLGRTVPASASASAAAPEAPAGGKTKARRKSRMSPAARQAARDRMKAYWARKKGGETPPANGNGAAGEAADRPVKARARRARRKAPKTRKA